MLAIEVKCRFGIAAELTLSRCYRKAFFEQFGLQVMFSGVPLSSLAVKLKSWISQLSVESAQARRNDRYRAKMHLHADRVGPHAPSTSSPYSYGKCATGLRHAPTLTAYPTT
jgi:hypothetical protein